MTAQAPTAHDEILELSSLIPERPKACIKTDDDPGGTIYELAVPEDFGAAPLARISRCFAEHDKLWEKGRRTATEDKRLEKLLNDLAQRIIPDAPSSAIAALPALQKRMVAVRFFVATGLAAASLVSEQMKPPAGDESPTASN